MQTVSAWREVVCSCGAFVALYVEDGIDDRVRLDAARKLGGVGDEVYVIVGLAREGVLIFSPPHTRRASPMSSWRH